MLHINKPLKEDKIVSPNLAVYEAVSYTHLDVYKRQGMAGGPGIFGRVYACGYEQPWLTHGGRL